MGRRNNKIWGGGVTVRILQGDCRSVLATLPDESVHCVVTSPPYWRQRDYGIAEQLGMEAHPDDYVAALVDAFAELRRVLVASASVWLNIGEKWAAAGNGGGGSCMARRRDIAWAHARKARGWRSPPPGYKDKDIVGAPWAVALALREQGWWLRQCVIWDKGVATEPPRVDRPSISHEYLFLLGKTADPATRDPGEPWFYSSVWTVRPQPRSQDHPAMMADEIVRRCIVASSRPGDTILDPFGGAGTTGLVADRLNRNAVLIEINPAYALMARNRIEGDAPLFAPVERTPHEALL
jgi:site-specific DNA-methyltransferase (cytosine-N4-specific)